MGRCRELLIKVNRSSAANTTTAASQVLHHGKGSVNHPADADKKNRPSLWTLLARPGRRVGQARRFALNLCRYLYILAILTAQPTPIRGCNLLDAPSRQGIASKLPCCWGPQLMNVTPCPAFARRLSFWGLVFLLAACSPVGPDYQATRTELPARWLNDRKQIFPATTSGLQHWWGLFQDTELDALIQEAVTANPDLAIAATRIREARAQALIAGAELLPTMDGGAGFTHSRKSEHIPSGGARQDLFLLHFDAAWELDLFGGYQRQVEAAEASLAATREAYRDVLVSLTAEVARHYIDLRAAQQRLLVARKNIALQQRILQLTQERFALGLGDSLAIAQARTQLALLQAQVPPLQSSEAQARHQLALLLGKQPHQLDQDRPGQQTQPLPPSRLPALPPSAILRQRPDIRGAERQLAAANAEVGVATADLFPRFSLSALIGLQSTQLPQLITSGSRYWSLGPAIQWPLVDGGRRRATLEASEARLDRARLHYQKTILTALAEVEDALVDFDREQNARLRLAEAVDSSSQAVDLSQSQYKAGLNTFLNVLLAAATRAQSEDKLAQSDQRLALAMVALYKAMGGGWSIETAAPAPTEPVNPKPSPPSGQTRP
jgi:NodT family efflux transporter outer membrane factor (OMF) lipoprotein